MINGRILVIAGSDSSAGAGIQADLKTAQAFGVYAQTAITAITAQNTLGVVAVQVLPPSLVRAQIKAALDDIGADVIKIGMLGDAAVAAAVADALEETDLPVVLDPVMVSATGARLLDDAALTILKTRLIPRALVVTPNVPESQALVGIAPVNEQSVLDAMDAFTALGAKNVLFKGGHAPPIREKGEKIVRDILAVDGNFVSMNAPWQDTKHTHGTGCTLASAIACELAMGMELTHAVVRAHGFVQQAISRAPGLGGGNGPLSHKF